MIRCIFFVSALLLTATTSNSAPIKTGRYTYAPQLPHPHQIDTLAQIISIAFPSTVSTYLDAIRSVIAPAGFNLSAHIHQNALQSLRKPLPPSLRIFDRLSRRTIINTLSPVSLFLVTDPHNKLVSFDFRPEYAAFSTGANGTIVDIDASELPDTRGQLIPVDVTKIATATKTDQVMKAESVEDTQLPTTENQQQQPPVTEIAIATKTDQVMKDEPLKDAQLPTTENEQTEPQYVTFALTSGRIKPQVERLLKEHFDNSPGLVWDLDENLYYQGEFELKGDSYHHILHRINLSYGAKAIWFGNNWVRIIPNN